jgi:hypothetical protein
MKPNPFPHLLFVASVAVAIASTALAQSVRYPDGYSEPLPPVCVTLFSSDHYRGESVTLGAGERWDDMNHIRFPSGRRVNNRVSSILIEGPAFVTLYDHRDFGGESISLLDSIPRLDRIDQERWGDWDNEASSIVVRIADEPLRTVVRSGGNHHIPFERTTPNPSPHFNHGDEPVRDLGDDNFEKEIMLDRDTVRLVERAYHDVLGRAPDLSGRSTYARVVFERGWDSSRLRKELRKSPEFRDEVVPRTIKNAYKEVLGRDVDAAGLRTYSDRMIRSGWSGSKIRDALKRSPEYINRSRRPIAPSIPRPDRPKATAPKTSRPNPSPVAKEVVSKKEPVKPRAKSVISKSAPPRSLPDKESRPPAKETKHRGKPPPPKLN